MVRWILVLWMLALPVAAQEAVTQALAALPEAQAKRLRADPDRFATGALRLIYGSGQGGAVTRAEAEAAAQIDLAARRARALGPFLQSDLDNDGAVGGGEVRLRAASLGADARARLLLDFAVADGDGDGSVSAVELRAMAEAAALRSGGQGAAGQGGAGYFAFDLDADGRLTVAEVEAVRAALAAGP